MKKIVSLILCLLFSIPSLSLYSSGEDNAILLPAVTEQDGSDKWGFINLAGKFIIPPKYDTVSNFSAKGIAVVSEYNSNTLTSYDISSYFINKEGKIVLGPFSCYIPDFDNGYTVVYEKEKGSKLVNDDGKVVITSKYRLESVSEGIVLFSETKKDNTLYGYMDMKGNIIISPKYTYAQNFKDGIAKVMPTTDKSICIDRKGNVIKNSDVISIGKEVLWPVPFMDQKTNKYGYKFSDGEIAIKPKFTEAEEFINGAAKVAIQTGKEEYDTNPALIDINGQYIIKPQYSGIHYIGQGLYGVNKKGFGYAGYSNYPNAIFNSDGKQLSDFLYYNLQEFNGNYASACSSTQTFFIDKSGTKAADLPVIDGVGTVEFTGDIIKANCDNYLSYFRKDGSLIWKQNKDYAFDSGITVKRNKFRPDYYTYIECPEISGLSDSGMQEKINKKLTDVFLKDKEKIAQDNLENESIQDESFKAKQNKDLLTIQANGYIYPIGAAHGMPYTEDYPLNLKTGEIYKLKDLFKANSKYKERLTAIIRNQIALNKKITDFEYFHFVDSTPSVQDTIGFTAKRDALVLTFAPYEVAAYAAGFVSFEIPYGQIIDIIDTKGSFWSSFDKEIKKSEIHYLSNVAADTSATIQNQIKAYENKIIEAINTNDFKKVEPLLYKDSSLYNEQKALIKNLNKNGIKEKLVSFEIYAMGYLNNPDEVKVYVLEDIGIKYSTKKNYDSRKYSWCYTVKYDKSTKSYKLSKISKW
ncbi:WG repeat-containing protein [Pseudobacteroides cellulosolvens]|uniref:Uncharacterized protein n=1 Tax=Pseudobacteroides cellulosolvens ATCC 35603 = DSM 2933 TaxID=398512 RepID=A0A0L6JUM2_9FIRM|nr:WG repeat-containing protein [Pseudobacteroides cellulosolvens]KNY29345.1 protein of unknown function DUF3298-containing protein [Pseudobacteroides cellulosolvens ATCC 35603 = DSM 2933]